MRRCDRLREGIDDNDWYRIFGGSTINGVYRDRKIKNEWLEALGQKEGTCQKENEVSDDPAGLGPDPGRDKAPEAEEKDGVKREDHE